MGYAKCRRLQQFDLWSDADDDCIRWDWTQISRVEIPAYRKHHLHLRKFANRFEKMVSPPVRPWDNLRV